MADSELWHVRVSADEVKTLTLEQIDDLFRLDVIDADTQLWQDGMDEWLPLRVVAGLDEEEVVNVSIPPTVPPPRLSTTASSWPPPAVAPSSAAKSSWPPPVARSVAPAAPSSRPVPSNRSAALAATVPSWPPAVGSSQSGAPASAGLFSLAPSYAPPPASVRPQMMSPVPFAYPRPTNPMPIVLAAIVGITITLYRNDLLHAGARTVGQEAAYFKLEEALGGPGFGTPRAVESMAKAAAALPDLAPPPAATSTSRSDSSKSDSSKSGSPRSDEGDASKSSSTKPEPTSRPEPRKVAPPAPQPRSEAAPRPVARTEAEAPNPVFKQPKGAKKAKGNEFDPLNPSL